MQIYTNILSLLLSYFKLVLAALHHQTAPKKAVKIKSAKSSSMCHRATQIFAKDSPGVRIDTGKLGQQLSYLFVPSKALSVSVSLFFFLSPTPYVRTTPTSASTSGHGSFEGSSFWTQKIPKNNFEPFWVFYLMYLCFFCIFPQFLAWR